MVAGVTARGWSAGAPPSLRSWGPTGAGGVGIQKPPPPPHSPISPPLRSPLDGEGKESFRDGEGKESFRQG
jgi:hypothetical protein